MYREPRQTLPATLLLILYQGFRWAPRPAPLSADDAVARLTTIPAACYRIHMNGIKQPSGHPGGTQLFDAEGRRLYLPGAADPYAIGDRPYFSKSRFSASFTSSYWSLSSSSAI